MFSAGRRWRAAEGQTIAWNPHAPTPPPHTTPTSATPLRGTVASALSYYRKLHRLTPTSTAFLLPRLFYTAYMRTSTTVAAVARIYSRHCWHLVTCDRRLGLCGRCDALACLLYLGQHLCLTMHFTGRVVPVAGTERPPRAAGPCLAQCGRGCYRRALLLTLPSCADDDRWTFEHILHRFLPSVLPDLLAEDYRRWVITTSALPHFGSTIPAIQNLLFSTYRLLLHTTPFLDLCCYYLPPKHSPGERGRRILHLPDGHLFSL